MGRSFYNTTGERGQQLLDFDRQARGQERLIFGFFRSRPGQPFSPSQVQTALLPETPLTSIRRAMTNLTKRGFLLKTDRKVIGAYARPEHLWIWANRVDTARRALGG